MKNLLTIIIMLLPAVGFAQGDDFGVYGSVGAEKKISKKLTIGAEAEYRSRNNAGKTDRWSVGIDAEYKLLPWLEAGAGYDFLYNNVEKYTYHNDGTVNKYAKFNLPRHRLHLDLTGTAKMGAFKLSLREQWQYTYRPEKTISERYDYDQEGYDGEEKTYSGKGKNVLRSRLKLTYNIPHCPVSPYTSAEMYNSWNIEKSKYTAGADWNINGQHKLGIYYQYQNVNDDYDDEADRHIIGISYNFKF